MLSALKSFVLIIALVGVTPTVWAAPTGQGPQPMADVRLLAANCFPCHGPNGNSVGIVKSLTGMTAEKIVKRMREYKTGRKETTIMGRILKGYSDREIDALAVYFGSNRGQAKK